MASLFPVAHSLDSSPIAGRLHCELRKRRQAPEVFEGVLFRNWA